MTKFHVLVAGCLLGWLLPKAFGADPEISVPDAKQRAAFSEIVQRLKLDEPDEWDRKESSLRAAIAEHKGTALEASLNISLANCEWAMGKKREAKERLAKVGEDRCSVYIMESGPINESGVSVSKDEVALEKVIKAHFQEVPIMAGDEALSLLYAWQSSDGEWAEVWKTADKLASRYPAGDRVKETQKFLSAVYKDFPWFPKHFASLEPLAEGADASPYFVALRRPHMSALSIQVFYVKDAKLREKMRVTQADGAKAVLQLLQTYAFLLSDKEVISYADDGIAWLSATPVDQWKGTISIDEATQVLKKLKNDRKAASLPPT